MSRPEVVAHYEKLVADLLPDLAQFERIKKIALLPREFTLEAGELTPTLKVKRRVVEEKYKDLIDQLYQGAACRRPLPMKTGIRKVVVLGAGTMGAQVAAHAGRPGARGGAARPAVPRCPIGTPSPGAGARGPKKLKPCPLHLRRARRPRSASATSRTTSAQLRGRGLGLRGGGGGPGGQAPALRQGGAAREADGARHHQHLRPRHRGHDVTPAGGVPAALPGHALLQPPALPEAPGDDPRPRDRCRRARRHRGLRRPRARQGRRPLQGHAQLHRQPHRLLRHGRGPPGHAGPRPHDRGGRLPHRAPRSGGRRARPSAPRTSRAWTSALKVSSHLYDALPNDPERELLRLPDFIEQMVERKWLGEKTGAGFYKKEGKEIRTLDWKALEYRERRKAAASLPWRPPSRVADVGARINQVLAGKDKAAEFLSRVLVGRRLYAATLVPEISDDVCLRGSGHGVGLRLGARALPADGRPGRRRGGGARHGRAGRTGPAARGEAPGLRPEALLRDGGNGRPPSSARRDRAPSRPPGVDRPRPRSRRAGVSARRTRERASWTSATAAGSSSSTPR